MRTRVVHRCTFRRSFYVLVHFCVFFSTSKQGRKVMRRHKVPSHRPATLFFLSESKPPGALLLPLHGNSPFPLRWASIRLIANFESVMNTRILFVGREPPAMPGVLFQQIAPGAKGAFLCARLALYVSINPKPLIRRWRRSF